MNKDNTQNSIIQLNDSSYHKDNYAQRICDIKNTKKGIFEEDIHKFIHLWFKNSPNIEVKTSGSTGLPKIINYSKEGMKSSALATGDYFRLKPNNSAFICLPIDYIAGKMMVVRAIILRLKLYSQQPSVCPKIERDYYFAAMTPMQVQNILNHDPNSLKKIKHLIIGGGQINDSLNNELIKFNQPNFYETFGMTETVSHIAIRKINGVDKQTSFHALDGVSFKQDKQGRLCISAVNLKIKELITNDIVILKSPKEFQWIGRWDNIINTGGLKIQPENIENKLLDKIDIAFFVAGIKDKKLGEKLVLFIQENKSEGKIDLKRLMNDIKRILSRNECPKIIIPIPLFIFTKTGKIKRKTTLQKYGY